MDPRLPNLFILGAQKAGTTALYRYLEQHPDFYFPPAKEPQFFCNEELYRQGLGFYISRFYAAAGDRPIRGDATPHYLFYEKVAQRLAALPSVSTTKFIVLLRDPVARAYSHYWNMVYEGIEKLSFREALAAECDRVAAGRDAELGTLSCQYFHAGLYAQQLSAYFRHLPEEQFLILLQDDLNRNAPAVLQRCFEFLDCRPVVIEVASRHNEAGLARSETLQRFIRKPSRLKRLLGGWLPYRAKLWVSQKVLTVNKRRATYPPLDPTVADELRRRFLPDVEALEGITGLSLSHWKPMGAGLSKDRAA